MKNIEALSQAFKVRATQSREIELHDLDKIISRTSTIPLLSNDTQLLPEVVLTPSKSFNEGPEAMRYFKTHVSIEWAIF